VQRPKRAIRKRVEKWVEAHAPARAPEPFVLHAVGEDSVPSGQSKTGVVNYPKV